LAPPKPKEFIDNKLFGNLKTIIQIIDNTLSKSYSVFSVTTLRRPSVRPGISVFGDL
jgi:hypothetical protein